MFTYVLVAGCLSESLQVIMCVMNVKNKISFNASFDYFILYLEMTTNHTMLWPCGHMDLHIGRDCDNECLECHTKKSL